MQRKTQCLCINCNSTNYSQTMVNNAVVNNAVALRKFQTKEQRCYFWPFNRTSMVSKTDTTSFWLSYNWPTVKSFHITPPISSPNEYNKSN